MTLEELLQQSIELENKKWALAEEQNTLARQTLEINNAIAEQKKLKEQEKLQVIVVEKIDMEQVVISINGTPRSDVLDILRNTPSRNYDYAYGKNKININYWNQFQDNVSKLPNVEFTYLEKNKEVLEQYFTEKLWKISKSDKFIIIKKAARNKDLHKVQKIPSAVWNTIVKAVTIPFSEGWRVIQVLPISDDVEYSDDVLELITKQVEQRKKMDEVALNQNADIPNPFVNNMELKPFQKAGVFFAMAALGIEIPMEQKKPEPKPW